MRNYQKKILNAIFAHQLNKGKKLVVPTEILSLEGYIEAGGKFEDEYYNALFNFINKKRSRKAPSNKYGSRLPVREVIGMEYTKYMNQILKYSPKKIKL